MNWARPDWLLALPIVALLAVIVAVGAYWHRRRLASVFDGEVYEQVLPRSVRRRRFVRDALAIAGLALAVIALAEPRFDKELQTVEARGTDIMLVVDLSRSMDARDVEPSRLERARREITDLVRVLEGDRVGLVVFAGGAYARMPLTVDYGAILTIADELRSDTFTAQGSAFGDAIRLAVESLQRSRDQAGQAILLLSDGEAHEGDDARAAAELAASEGIAIYTMGIGEQSSRIPDAAGWLTWEGEIVETTPDFEMLKDLSRATGGAFVKSVAAPTDIQGLYRDEMRRRLRAVQRAADSREVWRSAFQWPLGLAVLCLLASAWLGDGRRPWGQAA